MSNLSPYFLGSTTYGNYLALKFRTRRKSTNQSCRQDSPTSKADYLNCTVLSRSRWTWRWEYCFFEQCCPKVPKRLSRENKRLRNLWECHRELTERDELHESRLSNGSLCLRVVQGIVLESPCLEHSEKVRGVRSLCLGSDHPCHKWLC